MSADTAKENAVEPRLYQGKPLLVTGDRPTGLSHLGHLKGSLENRVLLQEEYHCLFLIADVHLLTTHFDKVEIVRENAREMVLDWLAVGLDPKRSWFYVQSEVPEIFELCTILSMLCTVPRAQRIPALKEKAQQTGVGDNYSVGLLAYPMLMAADILMFHASVVPVGEDQASHMEITRELARRVNHLYGPHYYEPEIRISRTPRLMGTDGKQKMSKSLGNDISLSHSAEEVEKRVRRMFTDELKKRKDDPGRPEVCNVFTWHGVFETPDREEISEGCKSGALGCVDCKMKLLKSMAPTLDPIRERRSALENDADHVQDILRDGTAHVQGLAKENMAALRSQMKLGYAE